MRRLSYSVLAVAAVCGALATPARAQTGCVEINAAGAEKRVALVIGNGRYARQPLANPANDAKAMAEKLAGLGFRVTLCGDLGRAGMQDALLRLGRAARGMDIAALFFAGHGIERYGTNYLVPVDAVLDHASDLPLEAVPLDVVLERLAGASRLRLVLLDACRNNPFALSGEDRSQSRGLAPVKAADNMLIAYAAKAGTVADDGGSGPNSPFTSALVKHLGTPAMDIRLELGLVYDDVRTATRQKQTPEVAYQLGGPLVLRAAAVAAVAAPVVTATPPASDGSADLIAAIAGIADRSVLEGFGRHGNEAVRRAAAARLAALTAPAPATPASTAPAQAALTRGTVFRDCADCPEMVVVPAGEFTMGSTPAQIEALVKEYGNDWPKNEGPQRKVTIAKPFAVGKFHVTFDEWDACVKAGGCTHKPNDQGGGRGRRPVVGVSWNDAKEYVAWLQKVSGKPYRLLTEAEFEYAARAGTTTKYWWGDDVGRGNANCDRCGSQWDNKHTAPVGSFKPNPFGLHDMNGNAWQWVEDCRVGKGTALDCSSRVIRGGSWNRYPRETRAAARDGILPDSRGRDLGFRLARTLGP